MIQRRRKMLNKTCKVNKKQQPQKSKNLYATDALHIRGLKMTQSSSTCFNTRHIPSTFMYSYNPMERNQSFSLLAGNDYQRVSHTIHEFSLTNFFFKINN